MTALSNKFIAAGDLEAIRTSHASCVSRDRGSRGVTAALSRVLAAGQSSGGPSPATPNRLPGADGGAALERSQQPTLVWSCK